MSTVPGGIFMSGFNQVYYSFSPTFADMQREHPVIKEMTKLYLTPMMYTLSIIGLAEDGSDVQVVTLGVSVIALNVSMHIAAPSIATRCVYKRFKRIV